MILAKYCRRVLLADIVRRSPLRRAKAERVSFAKSSEDQRRGSPATQNFFVKKFWSEHRLVVLPGGKTSLRRSPPPRTQSSLRALFLASLRYAAATIAVTLNRLSGQISPNLIKLYRNCSEFTKKILLILKFQNLHKRFTNFSTIIYYF